jgi:hypothetical protein
MFQLALATLTLAHAATGAVYIDDATDSVVVTVQNVSGSPDVDARQLEVTSSDPLIYVDGDFGCSVGSTAESLELMMGTLIAHPPTVYSFDLWDVSAPLPLDAPFGAFAIDHAVDIPATWDPNQAVTLGFNPVKIVEDHLETAEDNNADLVDWMRSDQVFEASFPVNAVVWCDTGSELVAGFDTVTVDVSIFYRGDPRIAYQPAVGTGGTDVDSGTTTDPDPGYDAGTGTGSTGDTRTSTTDTRTSTTRYTR